MREFRVQQPMGLSARYGGVVSLGAEIRSDPDRSFEEALLNTAPPSLGISASALLRTGG
jgi:hypothetical protein